MILHLSCSVDRSACNFVLLDTAPTPPKYSPISKRMHAQHSTVCYRTNYRMSTTNIDKERREATDASCRDLYSGFIRLHVLHHACKEAVFGLGLIEELRRHDYIISPGSLYPMLHGMEERGYLRSKTVHEGKSLRIEYQATPEGKKALRIAKKKIRELFREIVEEDKLQQ